MPGHAGAKPMKMLFKTTSSLYISLLFRLSGTAAWWFCHLLTLEIIFAGTILDSPYWQCVLPASRVILTSSIWRTWKSPTNDIVFHFRPGCLFKSSISAKAYLNKFLQISSLATEHMQACYFPPKLKGSQSYIFRRVEIYTLLSPKWGFWQNDIW